MRAGAEEKHRKGLRERETYRAAMCTGEMGLSRADPPDKPSDRLFVYSTRSLLDTHRHASALQRSPGPTCANAARLLPSSAKGATIAGVALTSECPRRLHIYTDTHQRVRLQIHTGANTHRHASVCVYRQSGVLRTN